MKLSEIKVPKYLKESKPSPLKIQKCIEHYRETGEWNKELYVNRNNEIVDGYIKYLVAKELGLDEISVRIGNKKYSWLEAENKEPTYKTMPTCYIFGKHHGHDKEYVWRVPNYLHNKHWEDDVAIGDLVGVRTKYGVRNAVVTRIEVLDSAPINGVIRNVTGWKRVKENVNVL